MNDKILEILSNEYPDSIIIGVVYSVKYNDICMLHNIKSEKDGVFVNILSRHEFETLLYKNNITEFCYDDNYFYLEYGYDTMDAIITCDIYDYNIYKGDRFLLLTIDKNQAIGINSDYNIMFLLHDEYLKDYTNKNLNMLDHI